MPVHGNWRGALAQALSIGRGGNPKVKLEVSAQLGLDHARVAMMTVAQPGGLMSMPATRHEAFVHAWAEQMLHVEPLEQVIRWHALADPRHVLVSCVRRAIAEDLRAVCEEAGAPLASCRPAVLMAVQPPGDAPRELTVVWTEDGDDERRHGAVQLLRFRGRRLTASWRGWVPPSESEGDLEGMVARFESETGEADEIARARVHWPPAA